MLLWVLLAVTARELLVGAIDVALLSRGAFWYAPDEHIYIEHAYSIWQHWVAPDALGVRFSVRVWNRLM